VVLVLDPQHRVAFKDRVELDLAALGLVVLGIWPPGSISTRLKPKAEVPSALRASLQVQSPEPCIDSNSSRCLIV
jgi:hypothetical protein